MIITAPTDGDGKMVAAAIQYAERFNWHVFPVKRDKAPATRNGFYDGSPEPDRIRAMFKRAGDECGIGLRTGWQSGAFVVDLDRKNGVDGFRDLDEVSGDGLGFDGFEGTARARTPSGGGHLFFECDEPGKIDSKVHVDGSGIDVRGEGAYVVIAPSKGYEWIDSPFETPITACPSSLWRFIQKPGRSARRNGQAPQSGLTLSHDGALDDHPGAREGERNAILCRLVGAYLAEHGVTDALLPLALEWGGRCQPAYPAEDVRKSVMALIGKHCRENPGGSARAKTRLVRTRFADIEAEEITWIWEQRIPAGKLTLLVGDPGQGKSFVALDVAAHVTTGLPFIDGTPCPRGKVLFFGLEDGAADTLRPRLDAAGADVGRIDYVEGVGIGSETPDHFNVSDHLPVLRAELEADPDIRLAIIDPVSGHLGKVDSHRNAEVRQALGPLCALAEKHGVAILGIEHLAKDERRRLIHRIQGSIAFTGLARMAWAVAGHPDDKEKRVLINVKSNVAKGGDGLGFAIEGEGAGRVVWDDKPLNLSADDLGAQGGRPAEARARAKEFLLQTLADGPVAFSRIKKLAAAEGVTLPTLYRAKDSMGIQSAESDGAIAWFPPPKPTVGGEEITPNNPVEI